jgi:hypothetical protein
MGDASRHPGQRQADRVGHPIPIIRVEVFMLLSVMP